MAAVCACGVRTPYFCFVHKKRVCTTRCILDDARAQGAAPALRAAHSNCVLGSYTEWLKDGDYDWPPRCALCFKKMDAEPASLVRLECLCEFHAPCLLAHFQKRLDSAGAPLALQCPTCERRVALAPVSALPATATPLQLHACGALESLARHKNLLPLLAAAGAAASSPAAPSAPPAGAAADGGAEDRREKPPAKAEAASLHRRPAAPPAAPVVTAPAPSDAAIQVAAAIAGGGAAAGGARPARPRLFGPQSQRPKCTQRRVIFAVMVLALVGMLTLWLQAFRSSVSLG